MIKHFFILFLFIFSNVTLATDIVEISQKVLKILEKYDFTEILPLKEEQISNDEKELLNIKAQCENIEHFDNRISHLIENILPGLRKLAVGEVVICFDQMQIDLISIRKYFLELANGADPNRAFENLITKETLRYFRPKL